MRQPRPQCRLPRSVGTGNHAETTNHRPPSQFHPGRHGPDARPFPPGSRAPPRKYAQRHHDLPPQRRPQAACPPRSWSLHRSQAWRYCTTHFPKQPSRLLKDYNTGLFCRMAKPHRISLRNSSGADVEWTAPPVHPLIVISLYPAYIFHDIFEPLGEVASTARTCYNAITSACIRLRRRLASR